MSAEIVVDAVVTVGGPFDLPHSAMRIMRFIVLMFIFITSYHFHYQKYLKCYKSRALQ